MCTRARAGSSSRSLKSRPNGIRKASRQASIRSNPGSHVNGGSSDTLQINQDEDVLSDARPNENSLGEDVEAGIIDEEAAADEEGEDEEAEAQDSDSDADENMNPEDEGSAFIGNEEDEEEDDDGSEYQRS